MSYTQEQVTVIRMKKTYEWSANRLGITVDEFKKLRCNYWKNVNNSKSHSNNDMVTIELKDKVTSTNINEAKGTGIIEGILLTEPLSGEEIEIKFKIVTTKWRLLQYWNKERPSGGYFVSANISKISKEQSESNNYQDKFIQFLQSYQPQSHTNIYLPELNKDNVALILPRQDSHMNKYDRFGNNNIVTKLSNICDKTINILHKVKTLNNIEDIVYIVGSDQFNSEWTGLTTKGTIQQNILTYEEAFEQICEHEVATIELLRSNCVTLYINYVCGNHDHYVGWHLIKWLESYFRNSNVVFNTLTDCRKYHKFGNTAIMFNHGDVIKHEDLAKIFPMEYKENWSSCDNYIGFSGDKHFTKTVDIGGILFYQIPQLSNAKSNWDDKQGYTVSKAEMTGFVISKTTGITDIIKERI